MKNQNKSLNQIQSGFTLIELITVIVLLGILGVTALGKFQNLSSAAHNSVVDGIAGAFSSGVRLIHMKWLVEGSVANQDNVGGDVLDMNSSGYPVSIDGSNTLATTTHCLDVFNNVLAVGPKTGTSLGNGTVITAVVDVGQQLCGYYYRSDTVLRRIYYRANTGIVTLDNP